MNISEARRRMERAGRDPAAIEDALDRLADDQEKERKDRAIEARLCESEAQMESMGYDLEALDRDNPYNQWMYA